MCDTTTKCQRSTPKKHKTWRLDLDLSIEILELPAPTQGTARHTSEPTRRST